MRTPSSKNSLNTSHFWLALITILLAMPIAGCSKEEIPLKVKEKPLILEQSVLITADDLPKYADTGKIVRFEVTSGEAKFPSQNLIYRNVWCYEKLMIYGEGGGLEYFWKQKLEEPNVLQFTCGDSKIPISVNPNVMELGCLDVYFRDYGNRAPAAIKDAVGHVILKPDAIYKEVGLPANKKLSVIAAVKKEGRGFKLDSFNIDDHYKGPKVRRMAWGQNALVSSLPMNKLLDFLESDRGPASCLPELNHAGHLAELPEVEKAPISPKQLQNCPKND